MYLIEQTFSRDEFLTMFLEEVTRCVKNSKEKNCVGPLPEQLLFYRVVDSEEVIWEQGLNKVKLPKERLLNAEEIIDSILNEQGWYPEWIHI